MARARAVYVCTECGTEHTKWQGQCAGCAQWNTLEEGQQPATGASRAAREGRGFAGGASGAVRTLADIGFADQPRVGSGMAEFDRVLGGGLVPGSVVLIGGDPGAGKSTLLLQVCGALAPLQRVLYVTGEESLEQVALRARQKNGPLKTFFNTI